MRSVVTGLLALAVVLGTAATADAKSKKKKQQAYHGNGQYYSPATVAERQRNARTFDETQYFEVDSRRLPFGSGAWWRQLQQENDGGQP